MLAGRGHQQPGDAVDVRPVPQIFQVTQLMQEKSALCGDDAADEFRVAAARRLARVAGRAGGSGTGAAGRRPSGLGVLALAIGICALTMLVAIAVAFRNDVIGTLLGDAVALRVRSVDLLAAIAAVLLGVLAVALAGLGGIAWPVGDLNSDIVWLAAIVAASGIGVATLAACVPALLLRRFPLSTLLAEE